MTARTPSQGPQDAPQDTGAGQNTPAAPEPPQNAPESPQEPSGAGGLDSARAEAQRAAESLLADLGLTADRWGASRRAAGLAGLIEAADAQREACRELIIADLVDASKDTAAALAAGMAAMDAARQALAPALAEADRRHARLAEAEARAATLAGAAADPDTADVADLITAESLTAGAARVVSQCAARLAEAEAAAAPLAEALRAAHAATAAAMADATEITGAMSDPWNHPRARKTSGWLQWVTLRWPDILRDRDHPGRAAARAELDRLLAATGIGREIQGDAIAADRAGDPRAEELAAGAKNFITPEGHRVVRGRDGVTLVAPGAVRGTPAARPQADTRTAAEIMAALRHAITSQGQQQ